MEEVTDVMTEEEDMEKVTDVMTRRRRYGKGRTGRLCSSMFLDITILQYFYLSNTIVVY